MLRKSGRGMTEKALVGCLIGAEITVKINIFKLAKIYTTTGFARMQEEKSQHIYLMEQPLLQLLSSLSQLGPTWQRVAPPILLLT